MGVKTSEHRLISHVGFGSRLQVELEDDMTIRWTKQTFQCNSNIFSLLINFFFINFLSFSIRHGPGGVAWSFMYHIMI